MKLPRWLDPRTNPAGWSAVLGLAYASWQAITAAQAAGPLTWRQMTHVGGGVLWAAVASYTRGKVTPVADPRDGNGKPLVTALPVTEFQGVLMPAPSGLTDNEVRVLKAHVTALTGTAPEAPPTPTQPEGKP